MAEYCSLTAFFVELTNAILHGETSIDVKKMDPAFKPNGVDQLIRLTSQDFELNDLKDDHPEPKNPKNLSTVFEEKSGFKNDIDGLSDVIENRRTIDKKKIIEENRLQLSMLS